jgi:hypothetical protein
MAVQPRASPALHSRVSLNAHTCTSCLNGPMTPLCTMRSLAFCCLLLLAPLAAARELQASGCTQVPEECTKVDCNGETGVKGQPPPPLPPPARLAHPCTVNGSNVMPGHLLTCRCAEAGV